MLSDSSDDRLLRALALELQLPLTQIARLSEQTNKADAKSIRKAINLTAQQSLWYIDGYMLGQQLSRQGQLPLEPVSLAAVLQQVTQTLQPFAQYHNVSVEWSVSGRLGPVMGHAAALKTAFLTLASALVRVLPNTNDNTPTTGALLLSAQRTKEGFTAGVFTPGQSFSSADLRHGKALYGSARQPLPHLTDSSAAGIGIADRLFALMGSQLRATKYRSVCGLAADFLPSSQLALW